MNAIEISKLTKRFGKLTAVDELTLNIRRGELFALLGSNGSGKTTTIKMLCGVLQPTEGDITVCGLPMATERRSIQSISNMSPQENAVAPGLSVKENLMFIAGIYGMSHSEAEDTAGRMMAAFFLTDRANDKAGKLSGGLCRRLSIAMALITSPRVLYLDEPTLGLDVMARRELWDTVQRLKGKVTVILTTHYLEEAVALADRIGIMSEGRLVTVGTADSITEESGCADFDEAFISIVRGAQSKEGTK